MLLTAQFYQANQFLLNEAVLLSTSLVMKNNLCPWLFDALKSSNCWSFNKLQFDFSSIEFDSQNHTLASKKVTWGVSFQGAIPKICRRPWATGIFFTWGALPWEFLPFLSLSPNFRGRWTHFSQVIVHFDHFHFGSYKVGEKFFAVLLLRHPRVSPLPL